MRLVSFRVRAFRNIVDSGDVRIDDVTCLVGKNEAGKSAMLQALHHLNPAKPAVTLSLLDEYPRWLKKSHEISGEIEEAVPISATFELTDDESLAVSERFGPNVPKSTTIKVSRSYAKPDELHLELDIEDQPFVEEFISTLPENLKSQFASPNTTDALRTALQEIIDKRDEENPPSIVAADAAQAAADSLTERLFGSTDLLQATKRFISSLLPSTFYFSHYSQLGGRYTIEEVFPALDHESDDEGIRAAADFLKLARVVPDTIEDWDFEASNAELESISSLLTKRVKQHWHQNDHLKLRVSLEAQQANDGAQQRVQRFLQFRVEDTRHDFSSRLDRRSTGFQWFISFLASFLEFEQDKNLILLLDEPGLTLHARAQLDLLETIEQSLAQGRQVIYTTHSPFMVTASRLDRARITEDQGPDIGSVVVNDAGTVSDPDTLFPLQAALGYDVAQHLFIGDSNVLVEGVSDFIYITAISDYLASNGRVSLASSCRLLPAGGASNIPTFIALVGVHLDVVVLLDGGVDRQRIDNAIARGRLDSANVLSIDQFCSVPAADIEDLFEPAEYLKLYNDTFGTSLKMTQLKGSDRIVKRIERAAKTEFNHGQVAAYFLSHLTESLATMSDTTLDRFEALIVELNRALTR